MGQPLTTILSLLLRLSIVRILFRRAIHPKIMTLGRALIFQMLLTAFLSLIMLDKAEKKEDTEKNPSFKAIHTLTSSPFHNV